MTSFSNFLSFSLFLILSCFATPLYALPQFVISDNATGGDCTSVEFGGIWDATSKTCTMTKDVFLNPIAINKIEGVLISSDNVTLDGNNYSLVLSSGNSIFPVGVEVAGKANVVVKMVKIINFFRGINLYICTNNTIVDNEISGSNEALFIEQGQDNSLVNNTINAGMTGLYLLDTNSNRVINNFVTSNMYGVRLENSSQNLIRGNTLAENGYGITIRNGSSGNMIYFNNFEFNNYDPASLSYAGYQIEILPPSGGNTYTSILGGNYWEDVANSTCVDGNGDGFCDAAFIFTGGEDTLPLVSLYDPQLNDADSDGIVDSIDNCIFDVNSSQSDCDGNGIGDVCDAASTCAVDTDGDTIADAQDNCPQIANADQANLDNDTFGDACDDDIDGDSIANSLDNCLTVPNTNQEDTDDNGLGDACTASPLCVSNSSELQAALSNASDNMLHDVIKIESGDYLLTANNATGFIYASSDPYSLVLEGGYGPGCVAWQGNMVMSSLVGEGLDRVLALDDAAQFPFGVSSPQHMIEVFGVEIRGGSDVLEGGGLAVHSAAGDIHLFNSRIMNNSAPEGAGVVLAAVQGEIVMVNNILADNSAINKGGGGLLQAANILLLNNTVVNNIASAPAASGGGLVMSNDDPAGSVMIYNNILRSNTASVAADLHVSSNAGGILEIFNNNIGPNQGPEGSPAASSGSNGNIDEDPLFAGELYANFHLTSNSPCLDGGENNLPVILAADFDGESRILDGDGDGLATIDMGADEYSEICLGDFDQDGDVDGVDLAIWASGEGNYTLAELLGHFGTRCY